MKILIPFLVSLALLSSTPLQPQSLSQSDEGLDSLLADWNNPELHDTVRFIARYKYGLGLYLNNDFQGAYDCFRELFVLGKELGGKYVPIVMQGLGNSHRNFGNYDSALYYAVEAGRLSEEANFKRGMLNSLVNQANAYAGLGEADSTSFAICEKCIEMAQVRKDTQNLITCHQTSGQLYNLAGMNLEAIESYKVGVQIAEEFGVKLDMAKALRFLAFQYSQMSNPSLAIELNIRALKIADEIGNQFERAAIFNTLGLLYKNLGEYQESLRYFKQSTEVATKMGATGELGGLWYNTATVYFDLKDYSSALKYKMKAQTFFEERGHLVALSMLKNLEGRILAMQGQHEDAITAFTQALEYQSQSMEVGHIYGNLARSYLKLEDFKKAISNGVKGFDIGVENQNVQMYGSAAEVLHEAYAEIGDYKNAYEYGLELINAYDSLNLDENKKVLYQKEYQYEYEKKALADSLAQNEAELKLELAHQEELNAETTTRNYLIGAGILLLLLAGGGWSRVQFTRKANAKLKVARDKAEESDRFKQRFLANMSHEIRTPMNAVLGMTQLTLDTELTDKQRTYLEAVHHSSENLLVIVNDILDLSKLEQGKLEFEKIPFRLKEQVEQVYQTLQFKAEEKGLEFNVKIAEDIPHRVLGDPSRLIQVLMNLASNAIKFTKEGSVSIEVERGQGEQIRFAVKDTGMGIAADKQDQLFESFRQLDESTSRKYGGTGLGLAISKDLVELQGGKISVKSKLYEGSVFSFELNLPKAQVEPALSKELTAESLKGIRILVAEDNQYNQIVVQDTLENLIEGVEVSVVKNGELAVKAFEKESFDVVLMDAHMPRMDGVAATKALRKAGNKTPIIALTASVLNEEIDNCLKAGMNDSLPKPFKREELLEVLRKHYTKG